MLIDKTYFGIGIVTVPGILSVNSGASFEAELTLLIEKYEPEYLRRILGTELYIKYVDETITTPLPPPNRWTALIDGTAYTDVYGNPNLWDGLVRTTPKCSPIANYVMRKYLEMKISDTTISGEKSNDTENAKTAALENKIVPIWNEMVKWNYDMDLFLKSYTVGGVLQFPEYKTISFPWMEGGIINDLDYNIEPDFIFRLAGNARRDNRELFQTINQLGF